MFKVKYKLDGSLEMYKARLVIRGDKQIEGFDYNKTFAPMAKMTSVQIILSVATANGCQ